MSWWLLNSLTIPQLRLLEALAARSRAVLICEEDAAAELKRRKLIERERRGSAIMRPTLAAMRALFEWERAARLAAEDQIQRTRVKGAGALIVDCRRMAEPERALLRGEEQ